MAGFKRRVKAVERQLGPDDRDEVIVVHPPKYANETDEEYQARIAEYEADTTPRKVIICADGTRIYPPREWDGKGYCDDEDDLIEKDDIPPAKSPIE